MDPEDNGMSEDAAEAALLESLMGEGADTGNDTDHDDTDEGGEYEEYEANPEDTGDEEGQDDGEEAEEGEEDGDDASATPEALADDHVLNFDVDGTAASMTVADLKALHGQREAISRKDKEVDLVGARAASALQTAIGIITEDLQPYANVDWLVLQHQMDPETFAWHRANATALEAKYLKLTGAVRGVEQSFMQRRQNNDKDAMAAAMAEMKADVPGWTDKSLNEILEYGKDQGLDPNDLAMLTNPKVFKIIRKAMLQDKAGKVATKKVKAAPAKVIKGAKASAPNAPKAINANKAMKRLQATGSEDAAVAALLARMG